MKKLEFYMGIHSQLPAFIGAVQRIDHCWAAYFLCAAYEQPFSTVRAQPPTDAVTWTNLLAVCASFLDSWHIETDDARVNVTGGDMAGRQSSYVDQS